MKPMPTDTVSASSPTPDEPTPPNPCACGRVESSSPPANTTFEQWAAKQIADLQVECAKLALGQRDSWQAHLTSIRFHKEHIKARASTLRLVLICWLSIALIHIAVLAILRPPQ